MKYILPKKANKQKPGGIMKKFICWVGIILVTFCIIACSSGNAGGLSHDMQSNIAFSIESGDNWLEKVRILIFNINSTPQYAAWIEDDNGNYIATIAVTNWTARNSRRTSPGGNRSHTLPVWSYIRHNVPAPDTLDAVSSATPKGSITFPVSNELLSSGNTYNVYLEVNRSFDFNEFWTRNNSGNNGQPSVIYHAQFTMGSSTYADLVPIGQGSVDGSNGTIVLNLENVTTALGMIKNVRLMFYTIEGL